MIPNTHRLGGFSRSLLFLSAALLPLQQSGAEALILFPNGNGLDGNGIGGSIRATDPSTDISFFLSTVDILGQDGSYASEGGGHFMNTLTGGAGDALGVASINDPGTWPSDDRDFNPGEAWIFSFDVDVELKSVDFAGWGDTSSEITLSFADGSPDRVLSGNVLGDTFHLVDCVVPAGSTVTMAMTNTTGDQEVRLKYLSVTALAPSPPPLSGLIYNEGDGSGGWTTTEENFLKDGLPAIFENGDDAIFEGRSNAAVNIQDEGVIAGTVAWTNESNGTLKFLDGDLTVDQFINTDNGSIAIQNTTTATEAWIYDGELRVFEGGDFTLDSLNLSGRGLFELRAGGVYNGGVTNLGGGGARISNEIDLSLGAVVNVLYNNPLEKKGVADLTLTQGLGTVSTGPVNLEIESGRVVITGTEQINIGGAGVFDGDLVMAGPVLELHGSTITGSGSIIVETPSLLSPRYRGGDNEIQIPIVFDADLTVDPGSGTNSLFIQQNMSGPGGLIKQGNGLMVIDQIFSDGTPTSYEGDTKVEAGVLRMFEPVLSNQGSIAISGNGVMDLRHGRRDIVDSLWIDGVQMEAGTYGSSSVILVTLDVVDDVHFSEDGYLRVLNGPDASDYGSWASGYGLVGGADDDDDGDTVSNGDEYAFGLNPTAASSVNPIVSSLEKVSGEFSYTRRNAAEYSTGLSYGYEYSLTLAGDWKSFPSAPLEVSDGGDPVETVTVTVPAELLDKQNLFVRIVAE